MGRLHIPAVNQISGPWLLSHDNLETLNILFNIIDDKLEKALTKTITNTAKQQMDEGSQNIELPKRIAKLQRKLNAKSKSAKITFKDGSTFQAFDIKEIANHVNANSSLTPTEIYIRTIHGNHENEFNLIINSNPSNEEADFEYRIRCLDYDIQLEIKTSIDKWIRENKASEPLKIWSNILVYFIWFIGFITVFISYNDISYTSSKAENYKTELKREAQKIIENKEYSKDKESTLLLLLKLQSDYIPKKLKSETYIVYNKGSKKVFITSLIIFTASLVRPKTIIGIGNKYKRYKLYKFWWRYIIFGGLSLFFTTLLADYFINFIKW